MAGDLPGFPREPALDIEGLLLIVPVCDRRRVVRGGHYETYR